MTGRELLVLLGGYGTGFLTALFALFVALKLLTRTQDYVYLPLDGPREPIALSRLELPPPEPTERRPEGIRRG